MDWASVITAMTSVALRKESVDRNKWCFVGQCVQFRRNPQGERGYKFFRTLAGGGRGGVALRKESVDRNGFGAKLVHSFLSSLSARRAWIEIETCPSVPKTVNWSLSARRAWIEMLKKCPLMCFIWRRSPQGERG